MTPEQRETLAQELERVQLALRTFPNAAGHHELADALRAALAPAPTCGTCCHVKVTPPMCGLPALYMCGNKSAPAHTASSVDPADGCIKGWSPKEPTR